MTGTVKSLSLGILVLLYACGGMEPTASDQRGSNGTDKNNNTRDQSNQSDDAKQQAKKGRKNDKKTTDDGSKGGGDDAGGDGNGSQTAGETYFNATVLPLFQANCAGCHAEPREQMGASAPLTIYSYKLLMTDLADGKTAEENALYKKIRSLTPHSGGDRCATGGANASPCKEISAWWTIEFGTPPEDAASRGRVTQIDQLGKVFGYAFNPADPTATITVNFYVDGPKGEGTAAGSVVANVDGLDGDVAGPHAFIYELPQAWRDGAPHQLYAYAVIGGAEKLLVEEEPAKAFTAYGFSAAGRAYYDANVRGKMTACAGCHTVSYEQQFFSLLAPAPSQGGTANNNQLFNKPSQANDTIHAGGRRCANANASPCKEFITWWGIEFGG